MWFNIETNPTFRGIQRVRQLAGLVITGKKQLQMFCSVAGIGKTETVLEVMVEHKQKPHYSSPTSAEGYAQDLWQHRDTPYFLDDCDRLARSEPCANIAKMAYGPQRLVVVPLSLKIQKNEERRIADDKYNSNIPPPSFKLGVNHGMIWNSNKNFTDEATVSKELANDFKALVSRGLDPYWVPSTPQSLFDYTVWMILTGMLRRHRQGGLPHEGGFKLAHQQEVLAFICTHAKRLKEITPRMAWKLAMSRRHDPQYQEAWREQLADANVWNVAYPDHIPQLIAPSVTKAAMAKQQPAPPVAPSPPIVPATVSPDPPAAVIRPERTYDDDPTVAKKKTKEAYTPLPYTPPTGHVFPPPVLDSLDDRTLASVEPDPDRDPEDPNPAGSPPSAPDPPPDPTPSSSSLITVEPSSPESTPDPEPERPISIGAAIAKIYAMKERTCAKVAEVLQGQSIQGWDDDTRQEVAEALLKAEDWEEHYGLAEMYFSHDPALKLFATETEVLQFDADHGLQIVPWQDVKALMAPHIEAQRQQVEKHRQQVEGRAILSSKLPKVRKLKAMQQRVDRLLALDGVQVGDQAQPGIDYVRAMKSDDPEFAACRTFEEYHARAVEQARR